MFKKYTVAGIIIALIIVNIILYTQWATKNSTVSATKKIMHYTEPKLGSKTQKIINLIEFEQANKEKKVVFLTFDDGPNARWTPTILNILDQYHVKATFFVVGTAVQKNPDLLAREVQEGHSIGNHTYDHLYREIYASPGSYIESLKKNDALLKSMHVNTTFTRPPGGHRLAPEVKEWLKQNNMRSYLWNLWSGDGDKESHDASFLINKTESGLINLKNKNDVILLMHDGIEGVDPKSKLYAEMSVTRNNDILALPEILKFFKAHGYTFEVIKQ